MSFQKIKDSFKEFSWSSIAPYLLAAGVVGLFAALIAYLVRGSADVYTYVPLLVGVVGILSFAFLDPDRIQSWMGSRQARYGTTLVITSLALLGIVILVNYIIYQASTQTKLSVDITEDQTNSLSDETIRTMRTLAEPIEIRAYFGPQNTNWETAQGLLDKYIAESHGMLSYKKIDPDAEPLRAKEDGVSRDGTMVLTMGEQKQLVTNAAENELTTAILKLMNPGEHKVYFLTGHGEATIEGVDNTDISTLVGTLRNKNYTVDTLNLTKDAKIPADTKVLVIAGPETPLLDFELKAIEEYLKEGGGLILLQNPYAVTGMDPAKDLLAGYLTKEWGVTLRNDIIIHLQNRYVLNPFASQYSFEGQTSPITERIPGNMYSVFPTAMSIKLEMPEGKGLSQVPFVIIDAPDEQVWGETDFASVGLISILSESKSAAYNKDVDDASPLNVGVSVEDPSAASRVVVFGDEDFAENQIVNQGAGANSDLIANAVDWASQQENLISLTPKDQTYRYMSLPQDAWVLNAIVLTAACLLPGSFILLYGIVWYNRRKHR
jgi:ABC-type uncharacterized transport system involved in gliding motility auxiliary subunit